MIIWNALPQRVIYIHALENSKMIVRIINSLYDKPKIIKGQAGKNTNSIRYNSNDSVATHESQQFLGHIQYLFSLFRNVIHSYITKQNEILFFSKKINNIHIVRNGNIVLLSHWSLRSAPVTHRRRPLFLSPYFAFVK